MFEILLIIFTIHAEAGNQSMSGKIGVYCVIRNRYDTGKYANYMEIILEPKQFSCYNNPHIIYAYWKTFNWQSILDGLKVIATNKDITHGATYYAQKQIKRKYHGKLTVKIGNHKFYKEKRWESMKK